MEGKIGWERGGRPQIDEGVSNGNVNLGSLLVVGKF